eukprot:10213286-Heterocapsa_arctica.AAC.1
MGQRDKFRKGKAEAGAVAKPGQLARSVLPVIGSCRLTGRLIPQLPLRGTETSFSEARQRFA